MQAMSETNTMALAKKTYNKLSITQLSAGEEKNPTEISSFTIGL